MKHKNKLFALVVALTITALVIGMIFEKSSASADETSNNTTKVVKVLIYDGEGVMDSSVHGLEECLNLSNQENLTPNIRFEYSTNTEINSETLSGYDILIIPGGETQEYLENYDINSAAVKQFLTSGKGYLGICAGAYAASNRIDGYYSGWGLAPDVNTKNVEYEGLLNLSASSNTTNLLNRNMTTIMHHAGPAMYTKNTTNVMAIYADNNTGYEGYAAIIEDTYGSGRVILTGSHPEFDPKDPQLLANMLLWLSGN